MFLHKSMHHQHEDLRLLFRCHNILFAEHLYSHLDDGKKGYEVGVVEDGKNGLAAALENVPHLLILDLMLPLISGEEVCKALREHDDEKIQKIPIIMLTAKSSEADAIVGRIIGANYYMTKPFSMEDLVAKIEKMTAEKTPDERAG